MLPQNPTPEEYFILMSSVGNLYRKVTDPIDKFIVALVFELGYTQTVVADCLEITSAAVSKRLKKIKKRLKTKYKIS